MFYASGICEIYKILVLVLRRVESVIDLIVHIYVEITSVSLWNRFNFGKLLDTCYRF